MKKFVPRGLTKEDFVEKFSEHQVAADELLERCRHFKKSFKFKRIFMIEDQGIFTELYLLQSPEDIYKAADTANKFILIDNKRLAA